MPLYKREMWTKPQMRPLVLGVIAALLIGIIVATGKTAATAGNPEEKALPHPNHEKLAAQEENIQLLASVVEGEAANEPYEGRLAVAAVVINRVEHQNYPDTVEEVVYQPGAFCVVSNGLINRIPTEKSTKAAREAWNGHDPTQGALYFWNPNRSVSTWVNTRTSLLTIGNHQFGK